MLLSGNRPHAIPDIIFASQTGSSKIPVRTGLLKTRRTDAGDDPLIGDLVQHEQLKLTDMTSILAAMKKVKNFVAESVPVISALRITSSSSTPSGGTRQEEYDNI